MKLMSDIAKEILSETSDGKIVELIAVVGGWKKLNTPTLSSELHCTICEGLAHYTPCVDPVNDHRKVWICANGGCVTNTSRSKSKATAIPVNQQRSILWPLFCEINGIGDIHYGVKFEDVDQSDSKRSYMLKFAAKPCGIIFMQGPPGTGKTFASMALCELFTRTNPSCVFTTQKQMSDKWLANPNYANSLCNPCLLVVDDFGISDITPNFMKVFMDLINTRMQWTNRGTVITTNLDNKKFSEFCGDALFDRINTGQKFQFSGKTRRIKKDL